jgi:hypothetical protein
MLFIAVGGTAAVGVHSHLHVFDRHLGSTRGGSEPDGVRDLSPSRQRAITFRSRAFHRVAFPKYLSEAVAFGEILVGRVGFPSLICCSIVALVVGLTNFFALKNWTFAANEQEPQRSV